MASAIFVAIQGCDYKEISIGLLALLALLLSGSGGGAGLEGIQITATQTVTDSFGGLTGQNVTFRAVVNDANSVTDFNWSFGDGSVGAGQTVTHFYNQSGTFHVKLTVNRDGTAQVFTTTYQIKSVTAAASSNLYWLEANPGTLKTCPINNCTLGTMVTLMTGLSNVNGIVIAGGTLYWTDVVNITSCPISNCSNATATTLVAVSAVSGITATNTHLYFLSANASLQRCPINNCNTATVENVVTAGFGASALRLTSDNTYLYWTDIGNNTIRRCPIATCSNATVETLISTATDPVAIEVTNTNIYFGDVDTDTINICPINNCNDGTFSPIVMTTPDPFGMTASSTNLYWSDFTPRQISTCPITGCSNATTVVLTSTIGQPRGITVGP